MNTLIQDLRYSLRALNKTPAFTVVAISSLALGIGVNTSIFSLVNAAILRPLPIQRPGQIVMLRAAPKDGHDSFNLSYPAYLDVRERNTVFSDIAAGRFITVNLSRANVTERMWGYLVTGNYFDVVGVKAILGRTFLPEEDRDEGASPVVVLSYNCWRDRLGSDPDVVGRTVLLNNHEFTVIGIAPSGFFGTEVAYAPELWVPMMMQQQADPGMNWLHNRREGRLNQVIARLKPGVSAAQSQAQMHPIADQLSKDYPGFHDRETVVLTPPGFFVPQMRDAVSMFGFLLLAVGAFVVLLACTNLAGLSLARAAARRKEIAVRLAIGAGRKRLLRQLLTESFLISTVGGIAGLLVALFVNSLLTGFRPPLDFPFNIQLSLDYRVFIFASSVSLLTGILFGLVPALQATRLDLVSGLKEQTSGVHVSKLRNMLVAAQVAMSFLLLVCAGLVLRSLTNAQRLDVGFNTQHALEMSFDVGLQGYDQARGYQFFEQALRHVTQIPGVEAAGIAGYLPLALDRSGRGVGVDGYVPTKGETPYVLFTHVSADYFKSMGISLLQGRTFTERDDRTAAPVIIVNEAFVRRYWQAEGGVGKRVRVSGAKGPYAEVVGVVKDGKYLSLGDSAQPFLYVPITQEYQSQVTMVVRTKGDPASFITLVRNEIRNLDPHLPVYDVKTLDEHMLITLLPARLAASLLASFGVLALILAGVGVYGVMLNVVTHRTREIGIRVALGATRADVARMIVLRGLMIAGAGVLTGIVGALGLTRLIGSLLYGVSATDASVFAAVSIILIVLAAVASYIPARRATKVDAVVALRYE